jgi:hypothetical protein
MDRVRAAAAAPQAKTLSPVELEAPGWLSFITDGARNNQLLDHNENSALVLVDLPL